MRESAPTTRPTDPARCRRGVAASIAALTLWLAVSVCEDTGIGAVSAADIPARQQREETELVGAGTILRLAYFDGAGLDAAVRQAMTHEVRRILAAAGIAVREIDVTDLTGRNGRAVSRLASFLRIILFGRSPMSVGLRPGVMGAVFPDGGRVDTVYVFEPAVLRGLGFRDGGRPRLGAEAVGRALGRVVVHEVGHALAPELRHRGFGIIGPTPSRDALLRAPVELDECFVAALRDGLHRRLAALGSKDK